MTDLIYSEGIIQRLSHYLRFIISLRDIGKRTVTSKDISESTKVNSAEVRRDLIYFGIKGKRGVGFKIDDLIDSFNKILGHEESVRIVLVGAGNLGRAILNYKMLNKFGFNIEYVFDNDKNVIGKKISGKEVTDISNLKSVVKDKSLKIAILAVSPEAAQNVTNLLVDSGIKVIINYTSVPVDVPAHINIQTADPIEILLHTLYYLSKTGQTY
ncbi:MAG: redox-sensing transcriptional repressor Rex [Actinobacteria bacterium]|nr:redox-sensing transcriptional repressor Rex [Actinomycetota bacterium]MCL6088141.1 redox-sensing transcriptional repressor Rex [Actinomycetota bacterium]